MISKELLVYMLRWQLSSIILYPCLLLLAFSPLLATVVANIVGSLIFYQVDKYIFKKVNKKSLDKYEIK